MDWFAWNYGKGLSEMTDAEIRKWAQWAADVTDGDQLRTFRAEAKRRGIRVV